MSEARKKTQTPTNKTSRRRNRAGITLTQLMEMLPNEQSATKWLEKLRWRGKSRACPACGSTKITVRKSAKPMPYRCVNCRKYFSVRTGTVLQSSKVPLLKWIIAVYLLVTNLKGVSSMKIHRDLGITQSSAWFLVQRIRQAFKSSDSVKQHSEEFRKSADRTEDQNAQSQASTKGVGGYRAMLKRGHEGVYHQMSKKHFHRYISEFAGRQRVRVADTLKQMEIVCQNMFGKRLKYSDLVSKSFSTGKKPKPVRKGE